MPYVMVPVPEEHVVDVMQYVTRLVARASRVPWDQDAVEQTFLDADEGARSLLSLASRTVLADKELAAIEAMHALELKMRDLAGILGPIDEAAKADNRHPLVEMRMGERLGPGGRTRSVRIVVMDPRWPRWCAPRSARPASSSRIRSTATSDDGHRGARSVLGSGLQRRRAGLRAAHGPDAGPADVPEGPVGAPRLHRREGQGRDPGQAQQHGRRPAVGGARPAVPGDDLLLPHHRAPRQRLRAAPPRTSAR